MPTNARGTATPIFGQFRAKILKKSLKNRKFVGIDCANVTNLDMGDLVNFL